MGLHEGGIGKDLEAKGQAGYFLLVRCSHVSEECSWDDRAMTPEMRHFITEALRVR
jgi:hypothetical protein